MVKFSMNSECIKNCIEQEKKSIVELSMFADRIRNVKNNLWIGCESEKDVRRSLDAVIHNVERCQVVLSDMKSVLDDSISRYILTEKKLLDVNLNADDMMRIEEAEDISEEVLSYMDDLLDEVNLRDLDWKKIIESILLFVPGVNIGWYKLGEYIKQKCQERMKLKEEAQVRIGELMTGVVDPTKLTATEKTELIELYEFLNPSDGKNMDNFLEELKDIGGDEHIQNIKLLAYTAEEPYRSIFFNNVDKIEIGTFNLSRNETQHYNPNTQKINLSLSKWLYYDSGNAKPISSGTYVTFFHECAHAIDDVLVAGAGNLTDTYVDANGNRLTDVLENNVRESIRYSADNYLNGIGYTDEEVASIRKEVEDAIMNCPDISEFGTPAFSSQDVEDCYNAVVKDVKSQLSGSSSDVFGGYTGNTLMNGTYHPPIRRDQNTGEKYSYWTNGSYDSDTDTFIVDTESDGSLSYTDKQAKEFFAEYMAAQMTGDQRQMKGLDAYNNDTVEYNKEMINN